MKSCLSKGALRPLSVLLLSSSALAGLLSAPALAVSEPAGVDIVYNGDSINFVLSADGLSVAYAVTQDMPFDPELTYGVWRWTPDGEDEILTTTHDVELTVKGISGDGNVVIGKIDRFDEDQYSSFIWDPVNGRRDLGYLPGGDSTEAHAVSRDGKVVVGAAFDVRYLRPFRWEDGQMVALDQLGWSAGEAIAVSADGRVIAGYAGEGSSAEHVGMVWHDGKATSFSGGGTITEVRGISADGSTVVGYETDADFINDEAYYWRDGKMRFLGTLGGSNSSASGVSADGRVIIGSSNNDPFSAFSSEAFRWTEETGLVGLGAFGTSYSDARGVSDDGRVVVGQSDHDELVATGYRWTEDKGMQTIAEVLTEGDVDVAGYDFVSADAVSADGGTIVGEGYTPDFYPMMWIARCLDETCVVLNDADTSKSFAGLGAMGETGNLYLGGTFDSLGNVMGQGGAGTHAAMQGSYDSDPTSAAALSFTHLTDDGLVGGLSFGVAGIETPLAFGGSSLFATASLTASVGQQPTDGFDWRASAAVAGLSGTIERGYLNGATPVTSRGETTGLGAGAEIELGWRIADIAPATSLRPYLGASVTSTRFAGFTETGGPFPATFGDFTTTQGLVRAGIEAEHRFESGVSLEGGLALVHRVTASSAIAGSIPGVLALSVPAASGPADWAELSVGLSFPIADTGTLGATAMVRVPAGGTPSVVTGLTLSLPL